MIHVLFLLLSENMEFLKCHVRGEKRRVVSQEANVGEMKRKTKWKFVKVTLIIWEVKYLVWSPVKHFTRHVSSLCQVWEMYITNHISLISPQPLLSDDNQPPRLTRKLDRPVCDNYLQLDQTHTTRYSSAEFYTWTFCPEKIRDYLKQV